VRGLPASIAGSATMDLSPEMQSSKLLESADALIFTSNWSENSPLSIIEAMMNGLPVVGSDLVPSPI